MVIYARIPKSWLKMPLENPLLRRFKLPLSHGSTPATCNVPMRGVGIKSKVSKQRQLYGLMRVALMT